MSATAGGFTAGSRGRLDPGWGNVEFLYLFVTLLYLVVSNVQNFWGRVGLIPRDPVTPHLALAARGSGLVDPPQGNLVAVLTRLCDVQAPLTVPHAVLLAERLAELAREHRGEGRAVLRVNATRVLGKGDGKLCG